MLNKCMVIGNLGKDAELRSTTGGTAVVNFSVGTTRKWKDKNEQLKEETEWVRVVYFGRSAEAVHPFLIKGRQVYIEGCLQTRKFEKDGQTRYTTEVKADRVDLLGRKERADHDQRRDAGSPADDDMPF